MVQLVLVLGVLNLGLGYGLAVFLSGRNPLAGFAPWKRWSFRLPRIAPGSPVAAATDTEPIDVLPSGVPAAEGLTLPEIEVGPVLPPVASVEELPASWRELMEAEQLVPRRLADGVPQALRLHLAAYRLHVLAAEARARLVLEQESPEALEQLVADFRFLHHEWLARLLEGAELLHACRGRLGEAAEATSRLEALLYDHAARMETLDSRIGDINFKTDVVLGCRQLLVELLDLATAVHLLRDDLTASLAGILQQQQMFRDLPHEQRLDPLTGRLNRIGLLAVTHEVPSEPGSRQAILIALDSFRKVNERLGTRAGDRTLRAFSHLLADLLQAARASAEIARISGTRFLLLVNGISREQATALAEQIRQTLEGVSFDCQGTCFELSARLGITTIEQEECLDAVLPRLAEAVDAAEIAGRNRCAIADGVGTRVVAPQVVPVISRRVVIGDSGEIVSQPSDETMPSDTQPLPAAAAVDDEPPIGQETADEVSTSS